MRLAIYCDYSYRMNNGVLTAELPVSRFLVGLSPHFERIVMTGRHDPRPGAYPYTITGVDFAPLPWYSSGARLAGLLRGMPSSAARYWRLLDRVDAAWVLGPTPLALIFALLTLMRRRELVLGVRQDLPRMFRHRYPKRRVLRWTASILEASFHLLARWVPVVVVGPDLARRYEHARLLHTAYVSLITTQDLERFESHTRDYAAPELLLLSVGRLDPEKNPLLLADVLSNTLERDPRWRLHVCGEGPLRDALQQRLTKLGVADRATLHGNVPIDGGLLELYQRSHALVHVSLSEGVPGVILESFATRLPVVATAVGGVPELVTGCGLLIPPDDAHAAAEAVLKLADNSKLRTELVTGAAARVRKLTLEEESARIAHFISETRRDSPMTQGRSSHGGGAGGS